MPQAKIKLPDIAAIGSALQVLRTNAAGNALEFAAPAGGAAPGYLASSNASGNTTISVAASGQTHLEVTTVSGAGATTRIMILGTAAIPANAAIIVHRVELPTTADITIEWRNATAGGTRETYLTTDTSGNDAVAEFYFNGTAWKFLKFTYPANA